MAAGLPEATEGILRVRRATRGKAAGASDIERDPSGDRAAARCGGRRLPPPVPGRRLRPAPVEIGPARSHIEVIARTDPGRGRLREASAPATPRARSRPVATAHQHQPAPVRNSLLSALPPEDLARLRPGLHPVELPFDKTLRPVRAWRL